MWVFTVSGEGNSTKRGRGGLPGLLSVGAEGPSPERLPYSGCRGASSGDGGGSSDTGVGHCRQAVTLGSESWESRK